MVSTEDFIKKLLEVPKTPPKNNITIEFQTFSGYGSDPIRDNHSPKKIQKARKIIVQTSPHPDRSVIVYKLTRLSNTKIDTAIPTLSFNHSRSNVQQLMLSSSIINAGEHGISTAFLYTLPFDNKEIRNENDSYLFEIYILFIDSNFKRLLHSFEFKPVRNHNFEGRTKEGRLQSTKNTDILFIE